jgi:hypothetical protein
VTGSYGETITNGGATNEYTSGRSTRNSGETVNGNGYYAEDAETQSPSGEADHDEYKGTDGDDESDDSEYEKREGPLVVTLKIGGAKLSEIANGQTRYDYHSNIQQQKGTGTGTGTGADTGADTGTVTTTKEWKGDVLAPDSMDIDKTDTTAQAEKENTAPNPQNTTASSAAPMIVHETG